MLPPIVIIWLTVETLMSAAAPQVHAFGPYDGPLAERQIGGIDPNHSTNFGIVADTPRLRAFEMWLRKNPIYVRVPGEKYLVYGLKAWARDPGEIFAVRINTLLEPHEQPLGPWSPSAGGMLEWVFAVVDHYGFDYAPEKQYMRKTRRELIDWYHSDSVPVDWHAVAERLRATGRPVPDDLFADHP